MEAASRPDSLHDLQRPLPLFADQVGHPELLAVVALHVPHHLGQVKVQGQADHVTAREKWDREDFHMILSIQIGRVNGVGGGPVESASQGIHCQVAGFCLVDEFWLDSTKV